MVSFIGNAVLVLVIMLLLTRGRAREFLITSITVIGLNNLVLPYHSLPFRSGRGLLLIVLVGLSVLYLLAVDIRGGEGLQQRLRRMISGYGVGILLLILIMFSYLLITRNPGYGMVKVRNLTLYTLLPIAGISLFTPFRRHELRLMVVILGIGALLVGLQLAFSPQDFGTWSIRKSVGEEVHPNNVARNIGIGIPIVTATLLSAKRLGVWRVIGLLGILVTLFVVVIITGSRGPLLAAAVAVILFMVFMIFLTSNRSVLPRFIVGALIATVIGGVIYTTYLSEDETFARIVLYASTVGANASDMSRLERYRVAWDGFIDSYLVGVGPGGFTTLWEGPPPGGIFDQRDYPHNFFLEVAAEGGLPGLLIVVGLTLSVGAVVILRYRAIDLEDRV